MPIQPLSDATSCVLTSAQSVNNATAVIKELIDNALDARASSVLVEVTANTLDKIVVKDDGGGIGIQDRQLLCKRGCTSKITTLDDLAELGGSFLGFRGTALASLADLSETVNIVTKVEGERVATGMTFGPGGKLIHSASTSSNVGTIVHVQNLLASIPVRRQVVLKNTTKVLEEIQKLICHYALARPTVKFLFKVLKTKSEKHNLSFAASKGEELLSSAATQVVGKPLVGLCRPYVSQIDENDLDGGSYRAEALLLAVSGKDIPKPTNVGQYVSVDGRPVSQEKGVIREIVKRYKAYLQYTGGSNPAAASSSRPFLVIHLRCPTGSYDVNVEPAKDVVLFHDSSKILALVEKLFVRCYGNIRFPESTHTERPSRAIADQSQLPFDTLLSRRQPAFAMEKGAVDPGSTKVSDPVVNDSQSGHANALVNAFAQTMKCAPDHTKSSLNQSASSVSANVHKIAESRSDTNVADYDVDYEGISRKNLNNSLDEEELYDPSDVTINNPFVRAKCNSILRPERVTGAEEEQRGENHFWKDAHMLATSSVSEADMFASRQMVSPVRSGLLPTPETSPVADVEPYQNPGPPHPRRPKRIYDDEEVQRGEWFQGTSERIRQSAKNQQTGLFSPDSYTVPSTSASPSVHDEDNQYIRALAIGGGRPHTGTSSGHTQTPIGFVNRPFRPHLKTARLTGTVPANSKGRAIDPSSQGRHLKTLHSGQAMQSYFDDDLQHILEFEHKKKLLNRQRNTRQTTILSPDDLARIQQASEVAVDRVSLGQPPLALQATGPSSCDRLTTVSLTEDDAETNPRTQKSAASNPHQNRFRAAIRSLQHDQKKAQSYTLSANDSHVTPAVEDLLVSDGIDSLTPFSDPRGFLIARQRKAESAPTTTNIKRTGSARLPLETIPIDERKHNLSTTPSDLILCPHELAVVCQRFVDLDPYLKSGTVDPVIWSPTSRHVERWQERIEQLVRCNFRAVVDKGGTGGRELTDWKVPLSTAINAHLGRA